MEFLIHHMLESASVRMATKEALVARDERLTYEAFAGRVAALAAGLRGAGLTRGERVGIFLDAGPGQAIAIFAVSRAGGVFVPINTLLFPEQVGHIVDDCRMTALITTSAKLAVLSPALRASASLRFVVVDNADAAPADGRAVFTLAQLTASRPPPGWVDWGIEKDLAAILYTSGSTGKPKGVMLSHAQVMAGARIVSTYLGITETERILAILPFSFDAGLNQLMTAVGQAATLVMMRFVFAREIVQMLAEERVTGLAGVPTLWSLLAQPSSSLARTPLPHLRYITNTGGAMPQPVLATLRQALPGTKVFLMYGLTEAFRSTYLPPEELDRRPTSMGRAIPDTEILVLNEEGQLCKPGEVGELVHRGPTVSLGYWGQPELTARVLRPHPLLPPELGSDEKVCYSGDLVTMDDEGFLYFIGRRDTLIKSSGFRVSPTEVEEVLFRTGRLKGAAVIGIPDDILGQAIKAFVVAADGHNLVAQELIDFCAEHAPSYMVPRHIEILTELPKTSSGKVDYPALKRREDRA